MTIPAIYFLRAKLHRPALPDDYIVRLRLLAQLEKITNQHLIAVIAPAGYGKTTLISAWVEQLHCPNAWITIDEGDNDLAVFLGYFLAAIRSIFPDFGSQILTFSHASALPPLPVIINYLLSELDKIEQDFVLVLDDFHHLTNQDIFAVLDGVLRFPLPHFRLALTSRNDLPSQLTQLRVRGKMLEVRSKDLRFSAEEVALFAEQTLQTVSDADTIRILTEKTEGWPVGLRLAIIAIRRWGVSEYQPAILQVDNNYVVDYLVNEVLARCPADVHNFLLKSSILDRFCAPLCATLLEVDVLDPLLLTQLEREGLFIESLDSHQEWYRYHQLFRALLRQRLDENISAEEVAALHLRASGWLATNGYTEDAIDHAILSGDMTAAANILIQAGYMLLENERWLLLETLLNKLPADVVSENANLLLFVAWLQMTRMQMTRLEDTRQRLTAHWKTTDRASVEQRFLDSSMHLFTAFKHTWSAELEQSMFHAQTALDAMQPEWGLLHGYAFVHLGTSTHFMHGGHAGLAVLDKVDSRHMRKSVQVRRQAAIAFIDWLSADLDKLLQTTQHGLDLITNIHGFTSASYLHYFAGCACYEQNDLSTAAHHFKAVLKQRYTANPQPYVLSAIGQAMVYQAQNKEDEACATVETVISYCLEMEYSQLLFTARTFQAELALRQGHLDIATLWIPQAEAAPSPKISPYHYESAMTPPHIWLAKASQAELQQAETRLHQLQVNAISTHNTPFQIKILVLQALLYKKQRNAKQVEDALVQAIRLGQPGGFIRVFVDLGSEMAELLKHLFRQGFASTYLQQLLNAFPTATKSIPNYAHSQSHLEPLTERELEILSLLGQRLTNKEIANTLVISQETVKRHTSNIYQKLNVRNRRQAVASAYSLGLIIDAS